MYKGENDIVMVQLLDNTTISPADCESMQFLEHSGLYYILDAAKQVIPIERTQIFVPITAIKRISFKITNDGQSTVNTGVSEITS